MTVKMSTGLPAGMSMSDVIGGDRSAKEAEEGRKRARRVTGYLKELEPYEDELTQRQWEFVRDTRARLEQFGEDTFFTDAQYGWAKGLWEKKVQGEDDEAERSYRRRGGRRSKTRR